MIRAFDLIVVGGGINGAAISRDAAMRGLRTLLLEADDFASGASGHNGRMIHGGLRYLENADLRLVREALREQATLLRIAPHLVRRTTLLLPVMKESRHPAWKVRLGLVALDLLAGAWPMRHQRLDRQEVLSRVPAIRDDSLRAGFVMQDATADHAERLTLEMVLAAAEAGAEVRNRARVSKISAQATGGLSVEWLEAGAGHRASAPVVVNATGAWVDEVLATATGTNAALTIRALGAFIVVRANPDTPVEPVFVESRQDGRPVLVAPWQGNILVGTTDRVLAPGAKDEGTTGGDIDYLFAALEGAFRPGIFRRSDILYTYWGVRSLPARQGPSHRITRRHAIHVHAAPLAGMLSVFGGKLSTCRCLAEETTDKAFALLGRKAPKSGTARRLLPGALPLSGAVQPIDHPVPEQTARRLRSLYGTRAALVRDLAARTPELAKVIDPASGAIAAEIVFAVRHEFAQSLGDILLRRTLLGYGADRARGIFPAFRAVARRHLGWAEARIEQDIRDYEAHLEATDVARFQHMQVSDEERRTATR